MQALATPQKTKGDVDVDALKAPAESSGSTGGQVRKTMCTPSKTATPVKSPFYKKGKLDDENGDAKGSPMKMEMEPVATPVKPLQMDDVPRRNRRWCKSSAINIVVLNSGTWH